MLRLMTVAAAVTEVAYALAGVNLGPFATVFPYEQPSDVVVWFTAGGVWQALGGADYALVPVGDPLAGGGQVTLNGALLPVGGWAAGAMVALVRATEGDQPSAFGEALGFSPQAMEQATDHAVRQAQDLATAGGRLVRTAPGVAPSSFAGQIAFIDADGFAKPTGYTVAQLLAAALGIPNVFVAAADDAAAAAAGVPVRGIYFNGSVVQVRLA